MAVRSRQSSAPARTVRAAAVEALHFGDDAGKLALQRGLRGRHGGERGLQQVQLAGEIGRQVRRIEAGRGGGQLRGGGHQLGVGGGGQGVGIVVDIGAAHPVRAARGNPQFQQARLGFSDELARGVGIDGRRGGRGTGAQADAQQQHGPATPERHERDYSGGGFGAVHANQRATVESWRMMVSWRSEPVDTSATVWPVTASRRAM